MGVTGRGVSVVQTFAKWVDQERRRMPAAAEKGEVQLAAAARAELTRFPILVAEQDNDLAFLKKAAAYVCHERNLRLVVDKPIAVLYQRWR